MARGAYAFTHALVRETLYGRLSGPRRQRLHAARSAGDRGGRGRAAGRGAGASTTGSPGPAGDPEKAIELLGCGRAPRRAELSAWEEAAAHWEGALAAMARLGGREHERAALLVALGDADGRRR